MMERNLKDSANREQSQDYEQDIALILAMEQKPIFANLRYIKRWYDFYYQRVVIRQRPVEELQEVKSQRPVDLWGSHKKQCLWKDKFQFVNGALMNWRCHSISAVAEVELKRKLEQQKNKEE